MSRKRPAPAYQEYASDILANRNYKLMSLSERGLWDTMRKECWVNESIPSSPNELAKYLGLEISEVEANLTGRVLSFFESTDSSLISPELDNYREELKARNQNQSSGGAKGGKTTQARNRKTQANLQAKLESELKPLRRDELNGVDKSEVKLGEDESLINKVNNELTNACLDDEDGIPY